MNDPLARVFLQVLYNINLFHSPGELESICIADIF